MIGDVLEYKAVGKDNQAKVETDLYTFKCTLNVKYILEVEHHPHDIFIIKFFQKNHRHSTNRYALLNTKRFLHRNTTNGAKNFLLILNTIISIIIELYLKNKNASFGFIGSPTKDELKKSNKERINQDGTVVRTKRYNTYGIYVKRYFSPETFEHIELETSSSYLIKSRKNMQLTTEKVEGFFENYIIEFC